MEAQQDGARVPPVGFPVQRADGRQVKGVRFGGVRFARVVVAVMGQDDVELRRIPSHKRVRRRPPSGPAPYPGRQRPLLP